MREELRNWAEANTRWDMHPAEDSRHYDTFVRTEDTAANATSVADYIYNLLQGKGVPVSAEQVAALVCDADAEERRRIGGLCPDPGSMGTAEPERTPRRPELLRLSRH